MNSNLTPAEQWRLHGAFAPSTANELLDLAAAHEDLDKSWAVSALNEVHANLPKEDGLTPILRDLAMLVKKARGSTKGALQELFNDLHAYEEQQRSDADHAHEQLNAVQNSLNAFPH